MRYITIIAVLLLSGCASDPSVIFYPVEAQQPPAGGLQRDDAIRIAHELAKREIANPDNYELSSKVYQEGIWHLHFQPVMDPSDHDIGFLYPPSFGVDVHQDGTSTLRRLGNWRDKPRPTMPPREPMISEVLDALHDAASKADGERYFSLFAPDAVFLGTDAGERWTLEEFKAYAMKRFETGQGWTYTLQPGTRHIIVSDNGAGDIAWFDELLDNAKYGTCRGSGVLRRIYDREGNECWRIVQYNLTFAVPNDAAQDVVEVIRRHGS